MDLPFDLVLEQGGDGRVAVSRRGGLSLADLSFDGSGHLVFDSDAAEAPEGNLGSLHPDALIQRACGFDGFAAALRAIEELLALQLEAGVKHLQRAQEEGSPQAQRMLPILAAQKAAKRQLHQALTLMHSDEAVATQFAVGIKSTCSNYSEELQLCIGVLNGVEAFLLQAGSWLTKQALGHPLEPITVAALVSFSAAGSQASAARGLLQDALQYWD